MTQKEEKKRYFKMDSEFNTTEKELATKMKKVEKICNICGEVYATAGQDYVDNYPNGSDSYFEQEWLRHSAQHEEFDHVEYCPDCGQVIGSWDNEYYSNYPTGFGKALEQAEQNHIGLCPAAWAKWREENSLRDGETPRQAVRRFLSEGKNPYSISCPPDREYFYGFHDIRWQPEIENLCSIDFHLYLPFFGRYRLRFNRIDRKFSINHNIWDGDHYYSRIPVLVIGWK